MFRDRVDAAERLLPFLRHRQLQRPVVLAIPRGGLVLGRVLADALPAELDVVLVRKVPYPGQPEAAAGAVAEDGVLHLNPQVARHESIPETYWKEAHRQALQRLEQLRRLFRQVRPPAQLKERSVIVVDDGLATGATMQAALLWLRSQHAHEIIVAVPVAAPDRLDEVAAQCDDVVCLAAPESFLAVGQWYEDFRPISDEEALALLAGTYRGNPEVIR
jgi:predicted phosphoribosyltransferase